MLYSYASAALLASATLSLAAPADVLQRSTFKVEQVATGNKQVHALPIAMMNTYAKYAKIGAVAPPQVKAAAQAAAQSGAVSAYSQGGDEQYLCPVNVGGTTMNLDFDTGSSDLWVFSKYLPSSQQSGHDIYSPSSSASRLSGETWNITYGDGSGAAGIVFADKVVVGSVTATRQAVEAATSISAQFAQDSSNDGLLGLAFSSINTVEPDQQNTFFDTVKSSLAKPLFAANLRKGATGSYDFGYLDTSAYSGSITYVNVDNSQGFWGFTAGGYSVGSATPGSTNIGSAIADTGTTLLYIPASAAKAYYAKVSGSQNSNTYGGYVAPCNSNWPAFNVKIGGTTFSVPGSYINYAQVSDGSSTCYGGIQSNTGIGLTIFGDIFLKSKYVVFDESTSTPRLGFANQA